MPLTPGATTLVQEVYDGRVWSARPMRVVEDSGDQIVLWFPRGSKWRAPARVTAATRAEEHAEALRRRDWTFVEAEWDVDTLQFWREGAWHAVWMSWHPDGTRWGYYGNIQCPFERTDCGLRTMDLVLDVTIDLDGTWRLKDEDELLVHLEVGSLPRRLETTIRAEAAEIVGRHERREPPFDGSWDGWRPQPGWGPPALPPDWETACR